jgi:hypothetical protein
MCGIIYKVEGPHGNDYKHLLTATVAAQQARPGPAGNRNVRYPAAVKDLAFLNSDRPSVYGLVEEIRLMELIVTPILFHLHNASMVPESQRIIWVQ